jgi:hypothetical protein
MGGWGAYLLSMLYPDRFAGALSVVGPPAIGFWFGAVDPIEPQNGRPLYFTNPLVGNARHVPTAIMHGTSDELVPISGTSAHAKTYLDNQQPYRFFLFAGYEHFSFALADEWFAAVDYLGTQPRVRRPARVTYTRMPCLDPMRWSPAYDEVADGAYWLDGIVVPDLPSDAACTSSDTPTAQLWHRGSVDFTVVTSYLTPRRMQPVAGGGGPPQHTGAYALTGYDADHLAPGTPRDQFQAVVRNVSSFRIAALEAGLDDLPMFGNIDTDRTVTIHLDGLSGGRVLLDGASLGDFTGSVTIPPGKHFLSILA